MNSRKPKGGLYLISAAVLVLTIVGCVLYVQRDQLLVHYHSHAVFSADQEPAESVAWLLEHKSLSLGPLLSQLTQSGKACERASSLIQQIVDSHADPTEPEQSYTTVGIAARLQERYRTFSEDGRIQSVRIGTSILSKHLLGWSPNVPTALETAGQVVAAGLTDTETAVRRATLTQMPEIWSWTIADGVARPLVEKWKMRCYEHVVQHLSSASADVRAAAAAALVGAPYHEGDVQLIALLSDADPSVQKASLRTLAIAAADSLTSDQKLRLIEFLADPDPEVRSAAENLLKKSGVSDAVIRMATLMKSDDPSQRAEVVSLALRASDVDPVVWLLELAADPSPVVRLAVARGAAKHAENQRLRQTLEAMANSDPDPNVRQISKQLIGQHSPAN